MREAIAFAQRIASEASDPILVRWAEGLEELVARQALYLVPRADLLSAELRKEFLDVLMMTFETISKDVKIEASGMLVNSIGQLDTSLRDRILEHVLASD